MFERLLGRSRFLVVLASASLLLGAITLLSYGAIATVLGIIAVVWSGEISSKMEKTLVIELINLVDLFLLGIVLLIIAAGLHQLFIGRLAVPPALRVASLGDLKEKLVSVIVVVLGVIFLGEVGELTLENTGHLNLIELGIGVAVVMLALTVFLFQQSWSERAHGHENGEPAPTLPPSAAPPEREHELIAAKPH